MERAGGRGVWVPDHAQLRRFGVLALCAVGGLSLGHVLPPITPETAQAIRSWTIYGFIALVVLLFVALTIHMLRELYWNTLVAFVSRSWSRPPWQHPRVMSTSGSRQEQADFRWLMQRLDPAPDVEPPDPADYLASETLVDRITGQRWRMDRHEHGFNQWQVLTPIGPPAGSDGEG